MYSMKTEKSALDLILEFLEKLKKLEKDMNENTQKKEKICSLDSLNR